MYTRMVFPHSRSEYEKVSNYRQLRKQLRSQMEEAGLKIRYYFCETSRKYLYVDCKDCRKKKMKYILRDGTYELVLFDNVHMHPRRLNERLTKNDRKRHMKRLNIVDEILALPKDMLISDLEETIRTKHNIHSQKKFIELVRMASHMNCTVQNVTSKLLDMGCTVWDKLDSDIECNITNMQETPLFLMLATPKMKQYYRKYGEFCYFKIYRNYIQKDAVSWEIAFFTGMDLTNRPLHLAVGFLRIDSPLQQHLEHQCALIHRFLKFGQFKTKTFFTPSNTIYNDIFKRLAATNVFTGLHLIDIVEEFNLMEKKLARSTDIELFRGAAAACSPVQFGRRVQKILRQIYPSAESRRILTRFLELAPRMVPALVHTKNFIGFPLLSSGNRFSSYFLAYCFSCLSRYFEPKVPRKPKPLALVVRLIVNDLKELADDTVTEKTYEFKRFELVLDLPQLEVIRKNITAQILELFDMQLSQIGHIGRVQQVSAQHLEMYDNSAQAQYSVVVVPVQREEWIKNVWKCHCLYSMKYGLPCCHELKAALITKSSLYEQIEPIYLLQRIERPPLRFKGRPAKTRRNMLK